MSIVKELIIKIINDTEGCTIPQLIDILYTKENYTKELLETTDISNFIEKTTENQISELSDILNKMIKAKEIYCITYNIPKDDITRSFLMPNHSKLIAFNNEDMNKSKSSNANLSIGTSLLYIFIITAWVFGMALSVNNMLQLIFSIIMPPFSWVITAQWIIGLIG